MFDNRAVLFLRLLFTGQSAGCPAGRAETDSRTGVKLDALKGSASR